MGQRKSKWLVVSPLDKHITHIMGKIAIKSKPLNMIRILIPLYVALEGNIINLSRKNILWLKQQES